MEHEVGLLGFPLTHSFSPSYFKNKWKALAINNWVYNTYEHQNIDNAIEVLKQIKNLKGFNITIPHKQNIVPFLNSLSHAAKAIGAVNCVQINNGLWVGHNTDCIGFEQSIAPLLKKNTQYKALVLGNGGAAKAIFYTLTKLGISYTVVERKAQNNNITYQQVTDNIIQQHNIIINTTPLGTFPNINEAPAINYNAITAQHVVYDLVYNPAETMFLQLCKAQGATIKNGSDMLALQAEESWKIWTSQVD